MLLDDGTRKYVWGLGLAYAVDSSGNVEVSHADGLGSVRALTDGAGTVVQTYDTDEFGVPIAAGTQGSRTQPFGYTGEQRDAESGFVYLRARMYDPAIGRFVQRDPFSGFVGLPLSLNRFTYVENNPTTRLDPRGLSSLPTKVLNQSGQGGQGKISARSPLLIDADALVEAAERNNQKALALIRGGETLATWVQIAEFFDVNTTAQILSRTAFLQRENISIIPVLDQIKIELDPVFIYTFTTTLPSLGYGDSFLVTTAKVLGHGIITADRRLYNYLTQTRPQLGVVPYYVR